MGEFEKRIKKAIHRIGVEDDYADICSVEELMEIGIVVALIGFVTICIGYAIPKT